MWLSGLLFLCTSCILLAVTESAGNNANDPSRALVLLAATSPNDQYYRKFYRDITNFQIEFAKRISAAGDNVIVLAPSAAAADFRAQLPADQVMVKEIYDIWIRDFGLVNMNKPTAMIFGNGYMSNRLARDIQMKFLNTIKGLCPSEYSSLGMSDVVSDGGNIVDNFIDTAILSKRVLYDNGRSESWIKSTLKREFGYSKVVLIPDPGDETGHADGMVSFIDDNQLAICTVRESRRTWRQTNNALQNGVPNLYNTMVELNSTYTPQVYDGFASACGLHINALLTGKNLFVPTYGTDPVNQGFGQSVQRDNQVLQTIRANTRKNVVEVPVANNVCRLGGAVRCLSTVLKGPMANCLVQKAQAAAGR